MDELEQIKTWMRLNGHQQLDKAMNAMMEERVQYLNNPSMEVIVQNLDYKD